MIRKLIPLALALLLAWLGLSSAPRVKAQVENTADTIPGARTAEPQPSGSALPRLVSRKIFKSVGESTSQTLKTHLQSQVMPLGYRGQMFLEIDAGQLHSALRRSLEASRSDSPAQVAIPVSEDRFVEIEVSSWQEGNFGVQKFRGSTVTSADDAPFPVSFRFDAGGNAQGIIKTPDRSYLIEALGERPYYVVFELENVPAGM